MIRFGLHLAVSFLALSAVRGTEPGMAAIPEATYRPFFRGEKEAKELRVAAFQLDVRPVTNGEFLVFVRDHPEWRRSQVKRLFADERYLAHWAGDLNPGDGRAQQPVTNVSWFAARAFAVSRGKRLPTTEEWEAAAGVGFTVMDGAKDADFQRAVSLWYGTPSPAVLPEAGAGRANLLGVRDLHGLVWEWTNDFNSALVTGASPMERQLFCGAGSLRAGNRSGLRGVHARRIPQQPARGLHGAEPRLPLCKRSMKAFLIVVLLNASAFAKEPVQTKRAVLPPCCRAALDLGKPTDKSLYLLASTWTSDVGRKIELGVLRGRPQVVVLFFSHCEYACPILVSELKAIEDKLPRAVLSKVDFLLVSIDSKRDTPAELAAFREKRQLTRERWTLLRGGADDVRELAALLGVNYAEDARGQFAHTNLITLLNAEGEITFQVAGLKQDTAPLIATIEKTARSAQRQPRNDELEGPSF